MVSEWMNTALLNWEYAHLMPAFTIAGGTIGFSPTMQWSLVPPTALLARKPEALGFLGPIRRLVFGLGHFARNAQGHGDREAPRAAGCDVIPCCHSRISIRLQKCNALVSNPSDSGL